jgi:uncharacterized protein (DUF488 family)
MYYRRKILLALLRTFGRKINKTDFQKYLFLFTQMQVNDPTRRERPCFDFVPYKYGCYSFQSAADKSVLAKQGLIVTDEKWGLKEKKDYFAVINEDDRKKLIECKRKYSMLKGNDLIKYVYTNYPYYAINSEIIGDILGPAEMQKVLEERPKQKDYMLFTIGYEGKTFEAYLNELIKNNIRLVCDVRRNAISKKFGFSKNKLGSTLESLHIQYVHIPELGIESVKRRDLDSIESVEMLFKEYEEEYLPQKKKFLEQINDLLLKCKRIALTCFESNHKECHRSRVAEALNNLPNWKYGIKHI